MRMSKTILDFISTTSQASGYAIFPCFRSLKLHFSEPRDFLVKDPGNFVSEDQVRRR